MVLNRRSFLGTAGITAASGWNSSATEAARSPSEAAVGEELRDLPEVHSRGGTLDYELTIAAHSLEVGGRKVRLDTYNGMLPGPMLRLRQGDRLRLRLTNLMHPMGVPPNPLPPVSATDGPLLQTLITTNLHTHGLQVSPENPADNVFLEIPPSDSHQFEYRIPHDQPTGLHWYHPHHHGSTSHQAWQGLAGPIVVEGDLDELPELNEMRERTLVISSLWLDENGETPSAVLFPTGGPMPFTTVPAVPAVPAEMLFPINGQLRPDIDMRPGETQRWRVLNAAPHRSIWLHVEHHQLHQIGQDGIPFEHPRQVESILLAPANRTEFVLRAGRPGRAARPVARLRTGLRPGAPRRDTPGDRPRHPGRHRLGHHRPHPRPADPTTPDTPASRCPPPHHPVPHRHLRTARPRRPVLRRWAPLRPPPHRPPRRGRHDRGLDPDQRGRARTPHPHPHQPVSGPRRARDSGRGPHLANRPRDLVGHLPHTAGRAIHPPHLLPGGHPRQDGVPLPRTTPRRHRHDGHPADRPSDPAAVRQ